MALDYFWDGQIRKYKLQFGRVFSTLQYTSGFDANGNQILSRVPCIPATADLQAMNIIANNTENNIPQLPMLAYYITNIVPAPERRLNPTFVRQLGVTYRDIDSTTGEYKSTVGNQYLVENYMPVPYNATFRLDLWFTNDNNREEIAEQIMTYFNPMIDLQVNRNMLDWSSLTVIEFVEQNWNPFVYGTTSATTTRTMSWTFNVPIWINPPSKVKKSNKIHEIINSIGTGDIDGINTLDPFSDIFSKESSTLFSRTVVTPGNFSIAVRRNYQDTNSYKVKLLIDSNNPDDDSGTPWDWNVLLQKYGKINSGTSNLLLMTDIDNLDHDTTFNDGATDNDDYQQIISGTISVNSSDATILDYTVDGNTVPQAYHTPISINACIDPSKQLPFEGMAENCSNKSGMTYLILNTIPQGSEIWGEIYENNSIIDNITAAVQNDILRYDGTKWNKIFNSITNKDSVYYGLSSCNGDYFTFEDGWWHLTIDGEYRPGYWRIRL